ncbi:MAG: hypothetical protein ABIP06_11905 [Pyrinomonadaceae bacterium]
MKFTHINLNGERQLTLNLSGIVGHAGANRKDDVMLIQGFFNYIAKGLYPGAVGLDGSYKIPQITGEMDGDTYSAIGEFQIRNAGQLLMSRFDGRIHPANYANRQLNTGGGKRYMSITLLHIMASDAAMMQSDYDYVQGLTKLNSELATSIDMAVINS